MNEAEEICIGILLKAYPTAKLRNLEYNARRMARGLPTTYEQEVNRRVRQRERMDKMKEMEGVVA